jgi:hypothetical protein
MPENTGYFYVANFFVNVSNSRINTQLVGSEWLLGGGGHMGLSEPYKR